MNDLTDKFMGNEFISFDKIRNLIPGDSEPFIHSLLTNKIIDFAQPKINWKFNSKHHLIKLDTLIEINPFDNLHIDISSPEQFYICGYVFLKIETVKQVYKEYFGQDPSGLVFSIKPTQYSKIDNKEHNFREWINLYTVWPIISTNKNNPQLYSELKKHFRSTQIGDRKIINLIPKFVEFEHFVHAYSYLYGGENFPKLSKQINDSGYTYNESAKQSEYTTGSIDPNNEKNNNSYMENLIKLFGSATKKNNVRLIESVLISMKRSGKYLTENNTAQEFQSYLINNDIDFIYEIQGDKIILNDGENELSVKGMMKSFRRQIKQLN